MKIKKYITRFLSFLVIATLATQSFSAVAFAEEKSFSGFSVDVVYNNVQMNRINVGETFSVRFWLSGIAPMAVMVPLKWDPDVLEVVDPKTHSRVSNGLKKPADMIDDAGFTVGAKCYDNSTNTIGVKKYWNGLPQYTENPETNEGYPYLNNDTGLYKFMYYVYIPTKPVTPQMFLEVHFKAKAEGDPKLRFATAKADGANGTDHYDIAAADGLVVLTDIESGEPESYTDTTVFPELKIVSPDDVGDSAELPKPPVISRPNTGGSGYISGAGSDDTQKEEEAEEEPQEPKITAKLTKSASMESVFPYKNADKLTATLKPNDKNVIDSKSPCFIASASVIDYLNALSEMPSSVIFKMPEEIPSRQMYILELDRNVINYLRGAGFEMVYAETPYGYTGLNLVSLGQLISEEALVIKVKPVEDGVSLTLDTENGELYEFSGNILRMILPYTPKSNDNKYVVTSENVFGESVKTEMPLSVSKFDKKKGIVIFLSSCTGEFKISERSKQNFNDMSNHSWAAEHILNLNAGMVINGVGDNNFNPAGDVTREQFAKMIVSAFSTYSNNLRTSFEDVDKEGVFFPYIASANIAGLVNGVSDTEFDGESPITRQDLAVIVYRATNLLGLKLPKVRQTEQFADHDFISDYAKDAVYALADAGIIDGTDSGFEPLKNCSRAEASKILNGVYLLLSDLL